MTLHSMMVKKNNFLLLFAASIGRTSFPIAVLFVILITSCHPRNPSQESYPVNINLTKKDLYSDLVINYRLDKKAIQDTFNQGIKDALSGEFTIPQYDVKMVLSMPSTASVEISGKDILINTPIAIEVEKKTFINTLKAKGVLEMSFITGFDVDSLWRMTTKTSLAYHKWVEKPKLSIAGLNIPIESISNIAIEKTKTQIEEGIDSAISENFSLQEKIHQITQIFSEPYQLAPPYFIQIKPEKVFLNRIMNQKFSAVGKIGLRTKNTISSVKPTISSVGSSPPLYWSETMGDSSNVKMVAEINMMDVNAFLKENMEGKTFTSDGKSITLSSMMTNCDYEFIRVVTDVSGTINGTLSIKAKPQYDVKTNAFSLRIADIEFRTKNVLHKAAAWIAEGKIKRELEEQLTFPVDGYIKDAQVTLDNLVDEIKQKYDIEMKVALGRAGIETFELKPGKIDATVFSHIYFDVFIKDFRSFNKF